MSEQKSIKKNMTMSIILTASNFLFPLITYSYVARVLTPVGTGKVAFIYSILQYFSYIAILGIPSYGLRECAKVRDDKEKFSHTVQELLIINLTSTLIAYIALFIAVLFVPKLAEYRSLFTIMSVSIILNTIGFEWVYQAAEEYAYITKRSLIFKCIAVFLTLLLIRSPEDILWYGFISMFTTSASYVCNFINIHKYVDFKKKGKYNFKRHFKPIFTLFAASIVVTLYANFDVSMIGFISTENDVGLYNAALKIKNILLSASTAITLVLIPRMAYYLQNKESYKAQRLILNSFRVSMILALPLAIYVFLFSENVLIFVCGIDYLNATSTLRVLMLCIIPLIITNIFGNQILIPMGREKRYSQSVFVGMWINLGLNMVMIPFWGSFGAAIGTLMTECWNVFWMSSGVKEYRNILIKQINYLHYLLPLVGGCTTSIVISFLVTGFNVFWQLVFTTIAFFGIFYFMHILFKEPLIMEQLDKMIKKIKRYKYGSC